MCVVRRTGDVDGAGGSKPGPEVLNARNLGCETADKVQHCSNEAMAGPLLGENKCEAADADDKHLANSNG